MRVLLVWPVFPKTFWSFENVLELSGKKTFMPPLGLLTVAALLPQEWEFRLIDRNAEDLTEADWAWADVVMLSAMIVQSEDFLGVIREARRREKPVVVGGPYVTSVPEDVEEAGADYIVLDEGEVTIPLFLESFLQDPTWRRPDGEKARRFSAKGVKPDVTETPAPRYDLVTFKYYDSMPVQYSRGCPFLCEFCDIINLYGRKPRTKAPEQLVGELQTVYDLGWRGSMFLVDDNFIGNKKNVKALLTEMQPWMQRHGHPFIIFTEASIDLAADDELIEQMIQAGFKAVFIGIETPDVDSLALTRKHQNNRMPMIDQIHKLQQSGLQVMAGFIIGFDGEKPGAGERIVEFVEEANISLALLSMLQVLPNTGLWDRLEKEGRLLTDIGNINQTTALNFVPTRPTREIVEEFLGAYDKLYDPVLYLERAYRGTMELGVPIPDPGPEELRPAPPTPDEKRAARIAHWKSLPLTIKSTFKVLWRQGAMRPSRRLVWPMLWKVLTKKPEAFPFFATVALQNEHFLEFREEIRASLEGELDKLPTETYAPTEADQPDKKLRKPEFTSHLTVPAAE